MEEWADASGSDLKVRAANVTKLPRTLYLYYLWQNNTILFCREYIFCYLCGKIRTCYGNNYRKKTGAGRTV